MKTILSKLIRIANSLDKQGFYDQASEIDSVISKLAANDIASQLKQLDQNMTNTMINTMVNNLPAGGQKTVVQSQQGKGFFTAKNEIERLVNTQPNMRGAYNQALAKIRPMIDSYVKLKQQAQQASTQAQQPGGTAGKGQQPAQQKAKSDPKILRIQKQYNAKRRELAGLIGKDKVVRQFPYLKPDGIMGKNTRSARPLDSIKKMDAMIADAKKPKAQEQQAPAKKLPMTGQKSVEENRRQVQQTKQKVDPRQTYSAAQEIFSSIPVEKRKYQTGQINQLLMAYIQRGQTLEQAKESVKNRLGV